MSIFVTGGSGFLGKHLISKLSATGEKVVAPSSIFCDLRSEGSLHSYTESFEKIYHLAAWTQAGDFCLRYPGDQWIINQQINTNVLNWWAKSQPQAKLVFIGTSCAYPEDEVLVEERYMQGEPTKSLYTYAMTKRMLLQGARALGDQFGLRWLCLVPSTLYGPGYHAVGKQLHFVYDLARKIELGASNGEPVVLWGDGFQRRELIHVEDFLRDLMELDALVENQIINIGAGQDHSIREFAEMLSIAIGFDHRLIEYDTKAYVGARSKLLSNARLEGLLGKVERVPIHDGLQELAEQAKGLRGAR